MRMLVQAQFIVLSLARSDAHCNHLLLQVPGTRNVSEKFCTLKSKAAVEHWQTSCIETSAR